MNQILLIPSYSNNNNLVVKFGKGQIIISQFGKD